MNKNKNTTVTCASRYWIPVLIWEADREVKQNKRIKKKKKTSQTLHPYLTPQTTKPTQKQTTLGGQNKKETLNLRTHSNDPQTTSERVLLRLFQA